MVENLREHKDYEKDIGSDTQYKNFCGVFDLVYCPDGDAPRTFSALQVGECFGRLFTSSGCRIWYAVHDADTIDGRLKVAHVHFILSFHRKRRWSTAFSEICEAFECPSKLPGFTKEGVAAVDDDGKPVEVWNPWLTMSACVSMIGAIRYLVHADDPSKYQYPFGSIITNDIAMAKMAMLCKDGAMTSDVLTKLVWDCHGNIRVICNMMGLDYFNKYNSVIRMLVTQYRYENDGALCQKGDIDVPEPKFA